MVAHQHLSIFGRLTSDVSLLELYEGHKFSTEDIVDMYFDLLSDHPEKRETTLH